jgi:hypothetical protein
MYKIWILMMLIIGVFAQFRPINLNGPQIVGNTFNPQRTTYQYVPPQSVGGGFQSSGGHVKMHETYHNPQSIGGGFQSKGGWSKVKDEPYVGAVAQTIIDIAVTTAGGHKSNNKHA